MPARHHITDLDQIDRRILRELQRDGRISNQALSERVNLSPTPCLSRVKRLERDGFITGYAAFVDPEKIDAALMGGENISEIKENVSNM